MYIQYYLDIWLTHFHTCAAIFNTLTQQLDNKVEHIQFFKSNNKKGQISN